MMASVGGDLPKVSSAPGGANPPLIGPSISPPVMGESASGVPLVPDVHDVPRVGYDPTLPPPSSTAPPSPPKP
jgi:hypothetical protein